jgi:hypothetical protein
MYVRVCDFLNLNDILAGEQLKFRQNLSTEKDLFSSEIFIALNNKMHIDGISCDLTEEFDCVNYEVLLSKLNFYGIRNIAGQWFKPYLHEREQQVEINTLDTNNSIYSDWGIIKHGVPQGSCYAEWEKKYLPY